MARLKAMLGTFYSRAKPSILRMLSASGWTDAEFDKLIEVDPARIVYYQDVGRWQHRRLTEYNPQAGVDAGRFVNANVGKILDGDWDLVHVDFRQNNIYRLLHERYILGVRWEETEIFRKYAAEIAAGERRWHWSTSYEELLETSREIETLYKEIRENGYRTRADAGRGGVGDEVTVSIGREGELLYNNVGGHHRLTIGKLLGLPKIPVQVLIRHRQWQDVRDEVRSASQMEALSARARALLGHPDLTDIE
ncbi:MAG: hypothetical protein WD273_00790 [Trueperaceae bacterium]